MKNLRLFSGTLAVATAFLVLPSSRAATLFPKPLHLVRAVDDSISGKSTTLDEFCAGNRIVTVRGQFVTVIDYDKQEVTEIDHAASTYSVTRFDDIARARAQFAPKSIASTAAAAGPRWQTTPRGMKSSAGGRSLESVEIVREGGEGKETIAKMFQVEMKPLSGKEVQAKSDADLKKTILEGGGKMKPVKDVDAKSADDIVSYLRTLAKK